MCVCVWGGCTGVRRKVTSSKLTNMIIASDGNLVSLQQHRQIVYRDFPPFLFSFQGLHLLSGVLRESLNGPKEDSFHLTRLAKYTLKQLYTLNSVAHTYCAGRRKPFN